MGREGRTAGSPGPGSRRLQAVGVVLLLGLLVVAPSAASAREGGASGGAMVATRAGGVTGPRAAGILEASGGAEETEGASGAATPVRPEGGAPIRVLIEELANGGPGGDGDSFFELANHSSAPVDLTGWHVYRCSAQGLRANEGREEVELGGVVLAPGARFTATRVGMRVADGKSPDAVFTQPYAASGFGLYLEDPEGRLADAVGVYPSEPWPTASECSARGNLPDALAFALGESWQRTAVTGDVRHDFVRARATPGAENARQADAPTTSGVRIDEIAAAGPAGHGDDFVELRNAGATAEDLGGWRLFRCTAAGRATPQTLQLEIPRGTVLAPGARYLVGGPEFAPSGSGREPDARTSTSLADTVSGVLLTTASGRRVDGISVSSHPDTACQTGETKLPSILDFRTGESWQRSDDRAARSDHGFVIAPRTPGRANATSGLGLFREPFLVDERAGVAISELATDPVLPGADARTRHNFVELGNYGAAPVSIGGWRVIQCGPDGFRELETLATVPPGTVLAPGATWLAAEAGTSVADAADARYLTPFDFLGSGAWVEDERGRRVDSVGAYHANEMDFSVDRSSPCTKGESMAVFQPDRLRGETYRRSGFSGSDADDFVAAPATPGRIDRAPSDEPGVPTAVATARIAAGVTGLPEARSAARVEPSVDDRPRESLPSAVILDAVAGTSAGGALRAHHGEGEQPIDPALLADPSALVARDDAYDFPYLRLRLDTSGLAPEAGLEVAWLGRGAGRAELQLSAWDPEASAWRRIDAASGRADDPSVSLGGEVRASEVQAGAVELLVQSAPRVDSRLVATPDGAFADPADYDLAISHLTDTQYLTEAYPEVYTELVGWIVANAGPRKIAFATHTGDLVQNWVDPDQDEARARHEFERASSIQAVLDDAGVPNSVLPGNHDNKRGVTNELFNEYFGPARYATSPWYGGSIAPDDGSAGFSLFEHSGARFLMLSLPYAFGERELAWAEQVVAEHGDRNVVVSTHEHLTPKSTHEQAGRSSASRWVSRADELWRRVVAPNRNVVAVLSGHFHGLGRIVTENAGGIPGHTVVELLADYQEFRTHTGERATGFQRLLQLDLGGGAIAVNTFSSNLDAYASFPYDYEQFRPENGSGQTPSNSRPWRILEDGLQERYTAADDDFLVEGLAFQYAKAVETEAVSLGPAQTDAELRHPSAG